MAWTKPKTSSTARGYNTAHRRARQQALARYQPGDPCCLCGRPMGSDTSRIHLDHHPTGGYRGLAHDTCNIRDGARRGRGQQNPPGGRTPLRW